MDLAAYHEAAHVWVARRLGGRVLSTRLDEDADPTESGCGSTVVAWPREFTGSEEFATASARVALAGPAAEIVLSGEVVHPATVEAWAPDWAEALSCAGALGPENVEAWCEERLVGLVALLSSEGAWPAVAALADHLAAHGAMEEAEIEAVLDAWTL